MVRPQPPRPEAAHHVDKLNLDFNRRHIVKHFLLNIHSHDKFNDLSTSTATTSSTTSSTSMATSTAPSTTSTTTSSSTIYTYPY